MSKTTLRLIVSLAATAAFLFFFFRNVHFGEVVRSLTNVNWVLVPVLVVLPVLGFVTRALRWRYLITQKKREVRFDNLFAATTVGFSVSMIFPGRVGEVVRPLYLARKEGLPPGFVIGTILVERVFDVFTMCVLLGLFLLTRPLFGARLRADAQAYGNLYFWGKIGLSVGVGLLALILAVYFFRRAAERAFAVLASILPARLRRKALEVFCEFIDGLKFFHSAADLLMYILFSFVVWLSIIFYYWMLMFTYRLNLPFMAVVPYVFLTGIGAAIPTPGMVGGFHLFSKLGLTSLYGVDPDMAAAMTLVTHALQVTMTCLLGYVILWKDRTSLFQVRKLGESRAT